MAAGGAIGGAIQAVGAMFEGQAKAQQEHEASNINLYQAKLAERNATNVTNQAAAQESTQRRKARAFLGEQRAAMAQSGFDPNSGSMEGLYDQSAANAELDALNIRYEGLLKRKGLLAQRELYKYQSEIHLDNIQKIYMQAGLKAASSMFSGFGGMGGGMSGGGMGG
jgi:hypothetical protein